MFQGSDSDNFLIDELRNIGGTFNPLASVTESKSSSSDAPALTPGAKYDALVCEHQVDLNNGENLTDLEDAQLQEHMASSRVFAAEQERARDNLPPMADIKSYDADTRKYLSSMTTSLEEYRRNLAHYRECARQCARDASDIAANRTPRNFPKIERAPPLSDDVVDFVESKAACLGRLDENISTMGNGIEALMDEFTKFARSLTLARRGYERAVDGLQAHLASETNN